MPQPITIPRLGWSMERGIFSGWLKPSGTEVREGEPLFLLEGDKATHEVEAIDAGVLWFPVDGPELGTEVAVGQVIGYVLAAGEVPPTSLSLPADERTTPPTSAATLGHSSMHLTRLAPIGGPSAPPQQVASTGSSPPVIAQRPRVAGPAARRLARALGLDWQQISTPDPTGRVLTADVHAAFAQLSSSAASVPLGTAQVATPRARRSAQQLGVDWRQVSGTGRNGRVRERDIIAFAERNATSASGHDEREVPPVSPGVHRLASKLRQTLARRMVAGCHQAAPVTLTTRLNAEPLIATRAISTPAGCRRPSYQDVIIYRVARLLRKCPELNSCWYRGGIWSYDAVHISFAVDTPAGLFAPVIENADQLPLSEISILTRQLADAARSGRLTERELSGGTFTVSNLGGFGVDGFTPILNLPQAAILGIGRIVAEPVVRNGEVVAGHTLTLSLTFDHRVLDGAPAAAWLQQLVEVLTETDLIS